MLLEGISGFIHMVTTVLENKILSLPATSIGPRFSKPNCLSCDLHLSWSAGPLGT